MSNIYIVAVPYNSCNLSSADLAAYRKHIPLITIDADTFNMMNAKFAIDKNAWDLMFSLRTRAMTLCLQNQVNGKTLFRKLIEEYGGFNAQYPVLAIYYLNDDFLAMGSDQYSMKIMMIDSDTNPRVSDKIYAECLTAYIGDRANPVENTIIIQHDMMDRSQKWEASFANMHNADHADFETSTRILTMNDASNKRPMGIITPEPFSSDRMRLQDMIMLDMSMPIMNMQGSFDPLYAVFDNAVECIGMHFNIFSVYKYPDVIPTYEDCQYYINFNSIHHLLFPKGMNDYEIPDIQYKLACDIKCGYITEELGDAIFAEWQKLPKKTSKLDELYIMVFPDTSSEPSPSPFIVKMTFRNGQFYTIESEDTEYFPNVCYVHSEL